jgi:hypothetical protein
LDEERFIQVARRVMTDSTPLPVTISITDAWLLVSALQLATRHPGLSGPMSRALKRIAGEFEQSIVNVHPDARVPLDMGWNPIHDVRED